MPGRKRRSFANYKIPHISAESRRIIVQAE